jgi:putative thioredoxin
METNVPANSPWIKDVTTERFEAEVIRASTERPMVVDFWATWCQPCRQLGPLLEKLAVEFNGRFQLVKVNVDENQELASAFGVQSIPYVVALRDGQVASEFVGVHPEDKLREWLGSLLPSKAEELLKKGHTLEETDPKGASAAYREAAALDPKILDVARIALARVLLKLNQDDECRKIIAELESRGYLEPEAEKVKSQLELRAAAAEAGPLDEARKAAIAAPDDLALQLKLADALAVANRHEEALQICLAIVQKDKSTLGGEAKSTMLRIFDALGPGSDLVSTYRRKLATALY